MIVPSEADLKSQINKFDNKLILIYSKSRPELLRVEIGIFCPFKSKDPEGDLLNFGAINDGIAFGYDIYVNLNTMKLGCTFDVGFTDEEGNGTYQWEEIES